MFDPLRVRATPIPTALVLVTASLLGTFPAKAASPSVASGPSLLRQIDGDATMDPSQMVAQTQDVPVDVDADDDYADTDPSAMTDFRSTLDPHGTWVDDPTYGTVWVPNVDEVGSDFAPYVSNGGWEYDDDYVWNSGYDWGWVPFHYGRWMWVDSGRWGWIPGRRYSGAWVNWRTGPEGYGYVGWGPAQPSYVWRGGVAVSFGVVRPGPVVFCSRDALFARSVGSHVIVGSRAANVAADTHAYVRADPVVEGRPGAQPRLHGPPPASLGIVDSAVVRPGPAERGVARARAYARPSTAQAFGARPPSAHVVRVVRPRGRPVAGGAPGGVAPSGEVRAAPRAVAPAPAPRSGGGHHR